MINYSTWDASDGNYMVINGVRYPVINSNVSGPPDYTDRLAWTIVTEGHEEYEEPVTAQAAAIVYDEIKRAEVQPATPADATARYIERPSGPPVRVDGPSCTPAVVSVPCLGEECTGCSDPQCWTARADGGDA